MTWAEILATYPFLQPLLESLKPVIGDFYHLLLSGLKTRRKAKELQTLTDAIINAQKALPGADISYSDGKWSITAPGAQPKNIALPPPSEMQFVLAERRYHALAGAVAEAAIELQNESNFPSKRPNEDWVARFVESASQVADQTMQELWGRILAGEIRKPGAFSLRTLSVVSNLRQEEAKLFESVAKHVVLWHFSFIPELPDNEFLKSRNIGFGTFRFLADTGLTSETPISLNLLLPDQQQSFFDYGRGRGILVEQKSPPITVSQNCWTLTKAGAQLVGLVERDANPENMQLLIGILQRHGLQPKVGSWAVKDNKLEFTPDEKPNS